MSKSSNKVHQTRGPSFSRALYNLRCNLKSNLYFFSNACGRTFETHQTNRDPFSGKQWWASTEFHRPCDLRSNFDGEIVGGGASLPFVRAATLNRILHGKSVGWLGTNVLAEKFSSSFKCGNKRAPQHYHHHGVEHL